MPQNNQQIQFALDFPQGRILFMETVRAGLASQPGAAYFQPHQSAEAFMVWGERKELFGKNAITVREDRDTSAPAYSVVHEFGANGALTDARLVSNAETLHGSLTDTKTLQALNAALAQGTITLFSTQDTRADTVFNVAQFDDGRLLIQLANKNELYLGTPGNFAKVDAQLEVQGGGSMYYKTATGERINLPYGYGGPGRDDVPTFKGEPLKYLTVRGGEDPAKFGLDLSGGVVHLSPFSPNLPRQTAPKQTLPKPPSL